MCLWFNFTLFQQSLRILKLVSVVFSPQSVLLLLHFLWSSMHRHIISLLSRWCTDDLSMWSSCQEFNTSGSSNTDTGKASGSLETKYKMKELGLSFSQKWNTDNTLATEVTVEDQVRACANIMSSDMALKLIKCHCWKTDDEVLLHFQLTQGLKVALDTSFVPNTGWDWIYLWISDAVSLRDKYEVIQVCQSTSFSWLLCVSFPPINNYLLLYSHQVDH